MKRKSHALGSSDPASRKSARGRQPLQLLTAEQRGQLPYTLPKASSSGASAPSTVCQEERRPSIGSIAPVSELTTQNEDSSPGDGQKSLSSPNSVEARSKDELMHMQRVPTSLWASSIVDMVQCDPLFPSKPVSIATSRSGAVTALLLRKDLLEQSARPDVLVAELPSDGDAFVRLQMASAAGSSLRAYYIFDGPGTEYHVLDDSLAVAKVTYLGACSISSIERKDTTTHVRVSLTLIEDVGTISQSSCPSDFSPLRKVDHSFLAFRCRVCGRANRKDSLKKVRCLHCATAFTIADEQAPVLLLQSRKMELHFTGCRSDLGQANILAAENAFTQRSVSTFSDGVRVCSYETKAASSNACSSLNHTTILHHVLRPGHAASFSVASLARPSTPFLRLSRKIESQSHMRGFVLNFGPWKQGLSQLSAERHAFSSASKIVAEQIAHLRASLQLADVTIRQGYRPLGCLFLLLQQSRLKIDATAFPKDSRCFGIVSLSELTVVSIKSRNRIDTTAVAKGRQHKESSLGSFVMQPRDTLVARNDLLQAVELEISSSGISLWAIACFADRVEAE